MGKKIENIAIIVCALAYIASWFIILFSLKSVTLMDPIFLTENLVGISYTAGAGFAVIIAMVYQAIYILLILPITAIMTYRKGATSSQTETDKTKSKRVFQHLDITENYPFV